MPEGGDPQFGAFSPVNVIIGFITGGTSTGFLFYWLFMWWLGGLGVMMLARHFKAPAWGGAAVALGFLFCGAYTGHAEHTSTVTAYSFLPFVIWRLDVALLTRRKLPAIEAGMIWGLSAMAGYPAQTIITGMFAGLWAIGRWLCAESEDESATSSLQPEVKKLARPSLKFAFLALTLLLFIGIIVLAPTYFAYFYEGAGTHGRTGELSREYAIFNDALAPGALSTFSSPYLPIMKAFSRTENDRGLWPDMDVSMCSVYCGAVITVLALLALFIRPKDKWRWWVLGIGLLQLAFAVGPALPLRGWLYDWVYPTRFFRHSALFRLYFIFAVTILAVIGTRDLAEAMRQQANRVWKQFLAVSILVAACALLVSLYYFNTPAVARVPRAKESLAYVHIVMVWLGICAVAFVGWMSPPRFRQLLVPALLLVLAAVDAGLTTFISIETIADRDPNAVKRWQALDASHSSSLDLTQRGLLREDASVYQDGSYRLDRTNDQMITKTPVFNSYATAQNVYQEVISAHPKMKKMAVGADRIWFSKQAGRVAPTGGNFSTFTRRVEALDGIPLVIHTSQELLRLKEKDRLNPATDQVSPNLRIENLPAAENIPVKLLKYSPVELSFEVQCAADGWLLVTDRWARGWRAEINGKPAEIYGGNFIFRAVQVSAGQNNIRFIYQPFGFPWLVMLSWMTMTVIAFSSTYRRWRTSNSVSRMKQEGKLR
jgi:hypothetical protein